MAEASAAAETGNPAITWGCGVHPGDATALGQFDSDVFAGLVRSFALVGEVGLDRRSGNLEGQRKVFAEVLRIAASEPVIVSIHSAGAVTAVLDLLEERSQRGAVLHWFLGGPDALRRASSVGAYFSVSGAMIDDRLAALPRNRVLPETDFPSGGRRAGARPGDVVSLETRLAMLWHEDVEAVRLQMYRNLRELASTTGAIERLPEALSDTLLYV
jgi:TatD DNase family protein